MIGPDTKCSICGEGFSDFSHGVFGFSDYYFNDVRFVRQSDSICHQNCIDNWELRDTFVDYYNQNCRDELRVSRGGRVYRRIDWFDVLTNCLLIWPAAFVLGPGIAMAECFPDTGLYQSLTIVVSLALFTALLFVTINTCGVLVGLIATVGLWLSVDTAILLKWRRANKAKTNKNLTSHE